MHCTPEHTIAVAKVLRVLAVTLTFTSAGWCARDKANQPKHCAISVMDSTKNEYAALLGQYTSGKAVIAVSENAVVVSVDGRKVDPVVIDEKSPYPLLLERLHADSMLGTSYSGKKIFRKCDSASFRIYLLDPGLHTFELKADNLAVRGEATPTDPMGSRTTQFYRSIGSKTYSAPLQAGRVYALSVYLEKNGVRSPTDATTSTWAAGLGVYSADKTNPHWEAAPFQER